MNYVYIVECSDGTFYTGWTNNLEKRIEMHSNGVGAKYTKGRGPVKLIYHEIFEDKKEAMRREYQIKQLTRKQKLLLMRQYNTRL
jgi:putative endonuclease